MKKQTTREIYEDMRGVVNKLEHEAHLTTMLYHYGKSAFDRGHRWLPVKKTDLNEYQHYWVRRVYRGEGKQRPTFFPAVLCEWTKSGWVDIGYNHLDVTTAVTSTIEVWSH